MPQGNKQKEAHEATLVWYNMFIYNENRDFATAKSQFSPNPMLKKGLTHYKE